MPSVQNVFESTTAAIVQAIEDGAGEWSMPWSRQGLGFPLNRITGKHYRGGNVMALLGSALVAGWECGQWATYKQWASIGAQVRKGERGTGCVFWHVTQDTMTIEDEHTGGARRRLSAHPADAEHRRADHRGGGVLRPAATSLFDKPSAASNTIRARCASGSGVTRRRW